MDTIRHIDTTIASDILDRYEKNDNVYIPYEIAPYSPGRIILASCDNIDILEETLDGKNTFHVETWMIAGTVQNKGNGTQFIPLRSAYQPLLLKYFRVSCLYRMRHDIILYWIWEAKMESI